MNKKKILICGASGFIGRNLFEYFDYSKSGFEVYGTFLKNEPKHRPINMFRCDLRNRYTVQKMTEGMDVVINAAAMTDGSGAIASKPDGYIADNIIINTNLIEAAYINKVKQFIFMSCSVMYPRHNSRPVDESAANLSYIHPKYFMGARIKMMAEDLAKEYSGLGNQTKFMAIRHSNIYGPYDKFDLRRGHVFAATVKKVMTAPENSKIIVWGNGQEERDFLHVSDLVNFVKLAVDKQIHPYDLFNVGSGKLISVNEIAGKIITLANRRDLTIEHDSSKPVINTRIALNSRRAQAVMEWKQNIDIDMGIRQTIDWYRINASERKD